MERKYKLIGITDFAKRYLCQEDIDELEEMIGSTIIESKTKSFVDGKKMFIMPIGDDTHIDFLQLEEIQPELPL